MSVLAPKTETTIFTTMEQVLAQAVDSETSNPRAAIASALLLTQEPVQDGEDVDNNNDNDASFFMTPFSASPVSSPLSSGVIHPLTDENSFHTTVQDPTFLQTQPEQNDRNDDNNDNGNDEQITAQQVPASPVHHPFQASDYDNNDKDDDDNDNNNNNDNDDGGFPVDGGIGESRHLPENRTDGDTPAPVGWESNGVATNWPIRDFGTAHKPGQESVVAPTTMPTDAENSDKEDDASVADSAVSNTVPLPLTQPGLGDAFNDNDSSLSDDSSSSDESSVDLLTIRQESIRRNEKRLRDLNLSALKPPHHSPKVIKSPEASNVPEKSVFRGMLFPVVSSSSSACDTAEAMSRLRNDFPGREEQMDVLKNLLQSTLAQSSLGPFVPAPIFVTGPSGSGKTSVVQGLCSVVEVPGNVGSAYLNCATLAPSSIETLLESAFGQLTTKFQPHRKRKRKERQCQAVDPNAMNHGSQRHVSNKTRRQKLRPVSLESRKHASESWSFSHSAVVAFGRALVPFVGKGSGGRSAIMVLDHAETLLTLAPRRRTTATKSNFLTQLLLLPGNLGLNLTIVVISRNALLLQSRINNLVPVEKNMGSLARAFHPVCVHFPAYKGSQVFSRILKTPKVLGAMVGNALAEFRQSGKASAKGAFQAALLDSFVQILVQTYGRSTRDVRWLVWAGRELWKVYSEPLAPGRIHATMGLVQKRAAGEQRQELLGYLSERLVGASQQFPQLDGTVVVEAQGMPYLTKCLLVAAFVCRHNKPQSDRRLFSIYKNGRQSRGEGDMEKAAYGETSYDRERLRVLRPRSFALERMLSVFVAMVSLHDETQLLPWNHQDKPESVIGSLGSSLLGESLAHLRNVGLLREIAGNDMGMNKHSFEGINMSSTLYCCDLEKEEAIELAASIGFELTKFLL